MTSVKNVASYSLSYLVCSLFREKVWCGKLHTHPRHQLQTQNTSVGIGLIKLSHLIH